MGEWHESGQTLEVQTPLERIPLFVPAAGIIPQGKVMRYVGAMADDLRQAYIFPHPRRGSGSFRLIEDDGLSLAYQRGEYAEVGLEVVAEPEETCVRMHIRRAAYPLPYRQIEFVLPHNETRPVQTETPVGSWTDHEGRRHIVVPLR